MVAVEVLREDRDKMVDLGEGVVHNIIMLLLVVEELVAI